MGDTKNKNKTDGRLERSKKSRDLIIKAMRDLIDEGILSPTAQQVAETAQVGIRTVFRHANDMETLFKLITKANTKRRTKYFLKASSSGSLEERIEKLADSRAEGYKEMQNFILATASSEWRYKFLHNQYKKTIKKLKKNLHEWLPEMSKLSDEKQEMIEAIMSFEFWYRLKIHQNNSSKKTIEIIANQTKALFK
jgi:AcrR family transcriptional regulator